MPPRNRISLDHRERIIRASEDDNEDYSIVSATIGVNRSTPRGIFARYVRAGRISERPRGGANGNVRVDDEMSDCLQEGILNENCFMTLAQTNYRQVCGQRGRNVAVALAVSPTNGLVFYSALISGILGQKFYDFLSQTRLNLDPDEQVILIYDGAPAHNNLAIPGPNS